MQFLIFFSIVLAIYFAANYYVFLRGLQSIPKDNVFKNVYIWSFWILASTYIIGRFLERIQINVFSDTMVWIGSFWLAALFYFFLLVIFFDLLRLINHYLPFLPDFINANYKNTKLTIFTASIFVIASLLVGGFINARKPHIKHIEFSIEKKAAGLRELNAVLISDIHLGTIIGNGFLKRIVKSVNSLEPDIIFIAGDILDEDIKPVIRKNQGEILKSLRSKMGVYAIMGNHEHIGGAAVAHEYLTAHNINMIIDSVVNINDKFYIIGRDDKDANRFSNHKRASLKSLYMQIENKELPVFLMDHQPLNIQAAADIGIDAQFSGHTHNGQIWPLNYLTNALFKVSKGYDKIDNMHIYVSTGLGTWGPPIRTGNRPEIVFLKIKFAE